MQKIKSNQQQIEKQSKLLFSIFDFCKKYWVLIVFLTVLSKCGYDFYGDIKMRSALKSELKNEIEAVVINEKYFWGNSPVSKTNTYKYEFFVKGERYEGICPNENYKPGNNIKIYYVVSNPNYNRAH
jgi:hypothetical protein